MLAAERLAAGTGGLILLEAEAGGGKSRLLTDILLASETLGLKVFGTSLSPIEQTTVYAAVRQFLPQLLMTLGEPVPVAPEMLRQRLDELLAGSDMQAKAPLLEDIFAAGIARTLFAEQITGAARRNSLDDLVEHLIVKAIPGGRLAIYIDDAHWLDASSAEMLAVLLRRVPTLAVVATMRPSIAAAPQLVDLMKAAAVKIHLPPLSRESIAQLACALLGVASIPERFAAYLYEHSGGLPLHAEQLLLSLRDRGVVSVSSGRCRVEIERLSPDGAPRGVRDIIVSRVDRLEPEAQMAMKVASVMGRVFSQEALRAIHPMAPQGPLLDDHLASLVEAGLLERAAALDTSRFTFRHGVIQEVVYGLLTFGQRRVLHREMAQHLEGAHADLLEPHYVELAEHWEQADDAGPAIRYREMAADSALRRYANYDVLTHVDRLDRLAQRLAVAMPREQKARLARLRGDACQELARFDEAQRHLRQCAELSGISIPTGRLGYAVGLILEVGRQIKHRTIGPGRLADGVAGERERLAAHIHMRLAEHAYFASNALGIMHGTLASLNRAERSEATTEVTVGYGGIAIALGVTGQHRLALYYGARSVAQAERIGTVHDQGIAHLLVAVYAFPAGDWAGVDDHCRSGAALFERVGDSFRRQTCEVIRAYGCIATGRYAEAEQILSSFGDDCEKVDNASVRAWISCARVMLDAVHGTSPAISLQRLAAGWDDTLHSGEKLLWSGMMAATLLQSGDTAGAEAAAERALDNMRASPPTIGVAFASIPSVAEIWLALARRAAAQGSLSHRYMTRAEDTCRLVRSYAAKTRIAFPRACLAAGRLSFMKGRRRKAVRLARRALHEAEAMSMPFEVSMCRDALAEFESGGVDRVAVKRVG
jgi:adenylate cyclase